MHLGLQPSLVKQHSLLLYVQNTTIVAKYESDILFCLTVPDAFFYFHDHLSRVQDIFKVDQVQMGLGKSQNTNIPYKV